MSTKEQKRSGSEELAGLLGVTPEELDRLFNLSEERLKELDEAEFRARMRERCHHTLEIPTYESAYFNRPLPAEQTETVEKMLREWERRGLSHDLVDDPRLREETRRGRARRSERLRTEMAHTCGAGGL